MNQPGVGLRLTVRSFHTKDNRHPADAPAPTLAFKIVRDEPDTRVVFAKHTLIRGCMLIADSIFIIYYLARKYVCR